MISRVSAWLRLAIMVLMRQTLTIMIDFRLRDDFKQLKAAFESQKATSKKAKKDILDRSGSRHSDLNLLPGWHPISRTTIDLMHNIYSNQASDLWYTVIVDGYLFTAAMWKEFENIINNIIWPSGIGRLPDNVRVLMAVTRLLIIDRPIL
jgi:hypothetical protein